MVPEESKGSILVQDLLLLGVLWLFHLVLNAAWLHLDNYPPAWDSAHHLTMTLRWLEYWQTPSLASLRIVAAASSYSPLPYWLVIPFYMLFGREADVAILGNGAIWLGVLVLATYGLGCQIHSRKTGLLAAGIVSLYPLIVALERDFLLDVALTATVALSLWLLMRCGSFDHRQRALSLGVALGVGSLIKWPFPFFLAAPFLANLYQVARHGGWSRPRAINLALCLVTAGGLMATLYLFNLLFLPKDLYNLHVVGQLVTNFSTTAEHPAWYTVSGLLYYGVILVNHQITFFFALLFLITLPAFFRKADRGRLILALNISVPFILATWLPVKEQRITTPYLPSVAVITAVGINSIRRPALRTGLTVLILGVGLCQLWATSFGLPALPSDIYVRNSWIELALFQQHPVRSPRDFQVQSGDWQLHELVKAIRSDAEPQGTPVLIQVPLIADTAACNPNTLNYYSLLDRAGIDFLYVWTWYEKSVPLDLSQYPYLVLKTGDNTEVEGRDREGIRQTEAFLSENRADFDLIYMARLPDGSEMQLYRRHLNYGTED